VTHRRETADELGHTAVAEEIGHLLLDRRSHDVDVTRERVAGVAERAHRQ
jgi:hypothetical protein